MPVPFTLLVLVVAVGLAYARGGRFHRIADAQLGWGWLLVVGVAVQVLVDVAAGRGVETGVWGTVVLVASQLLVLTWIVINRFRPGMPLVFVGLLLNAIVISLNGAMPVDPDAVAAIGLPGAEPVPGKHELMTDATRAPWLADILPLPPLRTVISVGDVVLAAGLIPLLHHLMTYRSPAERRGGVRTGQRRPRRARRSASA